MPEFFSGPSFWWRGRSFVELYRFFYSNYFILPQYETSFLALSSSLLFFLFRFLYIRNYISLCFYFTIFSLCYFIALITSSETAVNFNLLCISSNLFRFLCSSFSFFKRWINSRAALFLFSLICFYFYYHIEKLTFSEAIWLSSDLRSLFKALILSVIFSFALSIYFGFWMCLVWSLTSICPSLMSS